MPPILHFERAEFEQRIANAKRGMLEQHLDALVLFNQDSLYYLTGFDNTGWVFFQCAVMTPDSQSITLVCRPPDVEQARRLSIIEDIRVWRDAEGLNPADTLRAVLEEKGAKGGRIGIELDTHGITGRNYARVQQSLAGFGELVDGSAVVRNLRVIKSPAEIAYHRKAAELLDRAVVAMLETAGPGVFEGEIIAAGLAASIAAGADIGRGVLGSGDRALLVRPSTGYMTLQPIDQLTIEWGAPYLHHYACMMRTVAIGEPNPRQAHMFEATKEAIAAMTEAAKVGRPLGEIDDAHRRTFDAAGYEHARLSACGYSLGATFGPSWMDPPPMLYSGNPMLCQPGMVLFMHAILLDATTNLAMSLGHTVVIHEDGPEILSKLPHEYTVCR